MTEKVQISFVCIAPQKAGRSRDFLLTNGSICCLAYLKLAAPKILGLASIRSWNCCRGNLNKRIATGRQNVVQSSLTCLNGRSLECLNRRLWESEGINYAAFPVVLICSKWALALVWENWYALMQSMGNAKANGLRWALTTRSSSGRSRYDFHVLLSALIC